VDSSVGGKTGVNLGAGKNLVGSFHQPLAVYVDFDMLRTLPPREMHAGLQEAIKAGVIQDLKLLRYLERNREVVLGGAVGALSEVIGAAIRVKADVVHRDEFESGPRMALNFGHTLGHAIEAAIGYGTLLHGEAVGWGMIGALHLGLARGTVTTEEFARAANLILAYGPLPAFQTSAKKLVALSASDKKNRGGLRAFVLPVGIGSTRVVHDVTDAELTRAAQAMIDDMSAATGRKRVTR
jgi:3-dehydroquinate synthase